VTARVTVALFINIGDPSHYERTVERFAQAEAVNVGWKENFNE